MFNKVIHTSDSSEIEKWLFDSFVLEKLAEFSDEQKNIYFGKSLGELALIPYTQGLNFDSDNKSDLLNLGFTIYAQSENLKESALWLANEGLESVFHMNINQLEESPAFSAWTFYQKLFDPSFYDPRLLKLINKQEEIQERCGKRYHLINESTSLEDAILRFQKYTGKEPTINPTLVNQLKQTKIDQTIYKQPHIKADPKSKKFMLTFKNKMPSGVGKKQSFEFGKKGFSKEKIPPFQLALASIRDNVGFQLITNEVIDPYAKSYTRSSIYKILKSYKTNPGVQVNYDLKKDNYYILNTRMMNGIQMYLSPTIDSIKKGLNLPFENLIVDSDDLKDLLPVSFHMHGANAFAGNQLGSYDVQPHEQYKATSNVDRLNEIAKEKKPVRELVKSSNKLITQLFTFQPLYDCFLKETNFTQQ